MINAVFCSGSEEERRVYVKANHHNKLAQAGEEPGLHIKIKVTPDMHIGSDFDVYAELKNNTMVTKSCRVMFYAQAVFYNGNLEKPVDWASLQRWIWLRLKVCLVP